MHIEQILRTKGSDVVTARADETVAQAAIRMEANSIGALVIVDQGDLPVMENGKLAGLVSIGDMVKERLNEIEGEASALRSYIAGA